MAKYHKSCYTLTINYLFTLIRLRRKYDQENRKIRGEKNIKNPTNAGEAGKESRNQENRNPIKGRARQKNSQGLGQGSGQSPGKGRFHPEKDGKNNQDSGQGPGQSRSISQNAAKNGKKGRSSGQNRGGSSPTPPGDSVQFPQTGSTPPPFIGVSQIIVP